jgi:MerR HTH family regulatory protein
MASRTEPNWTIDELGAQVALALSVGYEGAPDSRTRDVPDRRTIRYYTTLGLIDRAAEMRGRIALYGRRHLLQLVAIKRLQARGLSLVEVQEHLLGLNDAALARLARVPDLEPPPKVGPTREPDETRAASFWATPPTPVTAPPPPADEEVPPTPAPGLPWQGIPLGERVLLVFEPSRPPEEEDLAAIRIAAAPLLKLLNKRRLLGPRQERGSP